MSNSLKDQLLGLGFKPVPKPERKPEASVRPSPKAVQPKTTDRTTVLTITTDAYSWVPGDADWDVGVPEVSTRDSVKAARDSQIAIRAKQRIGV